jgi:hypothetical protein
VDNPVQNYLMNRPRYWRLFRLTDFQKVEPEWLRQDLLELYALGGPATMAAVFLNSLFTHKRAIAIVSRRDLEELLSKVQVQGLAKGRYYGGKSLYQGFIAMVTRDMGFARIVNSPTGRTPLVMEVVSPKHLAHLPEVTEGVRATVIKAAGIIGGK